MSERYRATKDGDGVIRQEGVPYPIASITGMYACEVAELIRLANVGWNHELYLKQCTDNRPEFRVWEREQQQKLAAAVMASRSREAAEVVAVTGGDWKPASEPIVFEVWHYRMPNGHVACGDDNVKESEGCTTNGSNCHAVTCKDCLAAMQMKPIAELIAPADPFRGSVFSDPDAGKEQPAPVDNPFLRWADKVGR